LRPKPEKKAAADAQFERSIPGSTPDGDLPFFEFGKENRFAGRVIVAAQNGLAASGF
jgi:hypothetical protein